MLRGMFDEAEEALFEEEELCLASAAPTLPPPSHDIFDFEPTPIRPGAPIQVIPSIASHSQQMIYFDQNVAPQEETLQELYEQYLDGPSTSQQAPEPMPLTALDEPFPSSQEQLGMTFKGNNSRHNLHSRPSDDFACFTASCSTSAEQAILSSHLNQQISRNIDIDALQNTSLSFTTTLQQPLIPLHLLSQQQTDRDAASVVLNSHHQGLTSPVVPCTIPQPTTHIVTQMTEIHTDMGNRKTLPSTSSSTKRTKRKKEPMAYLDASDGPRDYDIVCSRGRRFYKSPGCLRFRSILEDYIPEYMAATTKLEKSVVIDRVIDAAHSEKDARFLRYHSRAKLFSFMCLYDIRDKVGHALRTAVNDSEDPQQRTDATTSDEDSASR